MYQDGSLPTSPEEEYSHDTLTEYVMREIYHSCVLDKERNGPFCFVYNIVNYIKKIMGNVSESDLNKDIKKKIFDLLRSVVPEADLINSSWLYSKHTDESSNHRSPTIEEQQYVCCDDFGIASELIQYPDSHLIYAKRWLSIIEGFFRVKSRQSDDMLNLRSFINNFETFLNESDKNESDKNDDTNNPTTSTTATNGNKNRVYQRERAAALSAVNRVQKSYSTRFLSWWSSVEAKLENPIMMQKALSDSLRAVFGFKTSFRPGFSPAINYRFDTKQQILTRDILNTLFMIVNEGESQRGPDNELKQICDDHKIFLDTCYNHTDEIEIGTLFDCELGINKIIIVPRPKIDDRTGKQQALKNAPDKKRLRADQLSQCLSQTKKFKKKETLQLNSLVFGPATVVNVPFSVVGGGETRGKEEEEEEKKCTAETEQSKVVKSPSSKDNLTVQVNCYQKTTTITTDTLFDDESIIDSFLDEDFMSNQSKVAIDLLQNENLFFVNSVNVLANELGF